MIDLKPDVEIFTQNGTVSITGRAAEFQEDKLVYKIEQIAKTILCITNVEVHLEPFQFVDPE